MPKESNSVYTKIKEQFQLDFELQLSESGYLFESFHMVHDLVNDTKYFSIGIHNTDLNFQDKAGLLEVLIKFFDREMKNLDSELIMLEQERFSRDFNDYRHFENTESISEKQLALNKIKSKLLQHSRK